jgi:outer membrane protein OmpA-like peptidoglycan-associated protein/Tol biopolymer transport system component
MMKKKSVLILIAFLLFSSAIVAQQFEVTTKSKKAKKHFDKAMESYSLKDTEETEYNLLKAIEEDPNFIEAWIMLAENYIDMRRLDKAIESYKKSIVLNPDFYPRNYYNLARIELSLGQYYNSKIHFEKFLTYKSNDPAVVNKITNDLKTCEFGINAVKNPVPFNPLNLGANINSENDEYSPALTVDEQTLVITVMRARDDETVGSNSKEEDFYLSHKKNGEWTKSVKIEPPLNTHYNEGAQTITPDGKFMVFTACNRPNGYGSCDLYFAKKVGDVWDIPVNLGPKVNSTTWDSQPSIAPDGKTIYFSSARSGGKGGMDIWKTMISESGEWSVPINLGDSINTSKNESSPFMHSDNQTLYFTSNGWTGMGGIDIYYSKKNDDGKFSKPVNLGYPINTFNDEGFLIVNAKGNMAYYSSDRQGGFGGLDIYSFELSEKVRPVAVTYLKGVVYDKNTGKKLKAKFELTDLSTEKVVFESYSDQITGEFMVSLPTEKNYALNVSKDGYLFYSENFTLTGVYDKTKPYEKDIPLQPLAVGEVVVLKNIFFDFDKTDLKPESEVELQKLIEMLRKNVKMKIEISGHTDNKGTADYNQKLSENRSKAVYNYLIEKGIDKTRLSYKGYGMIKPIDTNDTEDGRANNRRTEFKVIEN